MITRQELAAACVRALERFEEGSGIRADCLAIMYEPDPACPTITLFALPLADVMARKSEEDIASTLNPAEYADELEFALPDECVDGRLPRGEDLRCVVREVVIQLRGEMPDRLIYMTDPECSELADSVREARLPVALAWLSSRI